jgi:hypothetical protein
MRYALLLLAASTQAATLTVDPPVIYDCTGTFGKATVRWEGGSGPMQVLVGPSRAAFTGVGDTSGSAETGTWVGDGLEFRLVNQKGEVEALTVARVACDARDVPANGLVNESFFPLQPGNTWTYRMDSRVGTSDYATWTVTGMQRTDDRWYSVITTTIGNNSSVAMILREEAGVVYRLTGTAAVPREEVFLNARNVQHGPFRSTVGSYPEAAFQTLQSGLTRDEQVFVRGVGLARTSQTLLTGSSGGFSSSMELIDFHLASGPRVEAPVTPRVSLSIESLVLDITGKQLTNCAIPCYFAACGLGSPVDPPGTYKPCVRTRIEAAASGDFQIELTFQTRDGAEVYRSGLLTASGETTRYLQLPLYGTGNKLLPAGQYVVSAHMRRGQADIGLAGMPVEIR